MLAFGCMNIGVSKCFAAEVSEDASLGRVELTPNFDATNPRNPTDPDNPVEPGDPLNPGTNDPGPLSLDVVPQGFFFGQQKMYHQAYDYKATGLPNYIQYIQVTDNRDAGTYGWTVKVKQDGDLTDESNGNQLKGAYLELPKGIGRSTNTSRADHVDEALKTQEIIVGQEEQTIFQAEDSPEKAAGKGTSIDEWDSQKVVLHIPENTAKEGNYSNKIYWILSTEITK